LFLDI